MQEPEPATVQKNSVRCIHGTHNGNHPFGFHARLSWKVLAQKGSETIGALHTYRIIYPNQIRQQAKAFATVIRKGDPNVSLATVGHRVSMRIAMRAK